MISCLELCQLATRSKQETLGDPSVSDQFFRLWDSFLLHLEDDGGSEYDRI